MRTCSSSSRARGGETTPPSRPGRGRADPRGEQNPKLSESEIFPINQLAEYREEDDRFQPAEYVFENASPTTTGLLPTTTAKSDIFFHTNVSPQLNVPDETGWAGISKQLRVSADTRFCIATSWVDERPVSAQLPWEAALLEPPSSPIGAGFPPSGTAGGNGVDVIQSGGERGRWGPTRTSSGASFFSGLEPLYLGIGGIIVLAMLVCCCACWAGRRRAKKKTRKFPTLVVARSRSRSFNEDEETCSSSSETSPGSGPGAYGGSRAEDTRSRKQRSKLCPPSASHGGVVSSAPVRTRTPLLSRAARRVQKKPPAIRPPKKVVASKRRSSSSSENSSDSVEDVEDSVEEAEVV